MKYGRKNQVSLNPLDYNICLLGEAKIGKTTVIHEVCQKLVGEDGYLFCEMGAEHGADAIQGIPYINCPSWSDDYDELENTIGIQTLVDDIADNKSEDYAELKTVVIDTYDFFIELAEAESIRQYNKQCRERGDADKVVKTINAAWGGYGRGEKEAIKLMKAAGEPYKVELIEAFADDELITTYTQGDYIEVCRGPHVKSTGVIKAFKLTKISGAYLKGDSKNKMLTRIYGVVFDKKSEMDEYFKLLEEAMKRDHRKIGRDLELFFFDETAPGMAYWLPKGFTMFNALVDYWRDLHKKKGYQEFAGPLLNSSVLWKTSGHWDHYKDDMFVLTDVDGNEQALKPMSCPNSIKVFASKVRSYKDLPLRFNDIDVIHRNEKSGQLNGLFRVRMFHQDDSHNFVTEDQIGSEIKEILSIAKEIYDVFGLPYVLTLSTRPDDFMGHIETWNKAEKELKDVLNEICGEGKYRINEGDGAFYGPKIDIKMQDCLGREWQMGTIQVDFQLPSRFDLSYNDKDGSKKMPIMIHRALYGSFERFIGIITEHFAGSFPTWICPVQAKVISVSEKSAEYANKISSMLFDSGIRVETDNSDERIGYKIRLAQLEKVPYMFILGENEANSGKVSIRKRNGEEIKDLSFEDALAIIKQDINEKRI